MKRQFKTDGLGLSNRKAMNEDRLSELPDALLLHIMSSLPTENAIATSVLSKRWRALWKMVPILKFDSHQVLHNRDFRVFSENVYRSLTLHKAPVLESLHLKFKGKIDCVDVGIWIATAFARRVRKLVLVSAYQEEQIFVLPSVLFTYNDTLEILKLKYSIEIDFPSRVCLNSLRKLCLNQVRYKDEESVSNFLCGCPSLEDLVVHRNRIADVATFTITVPSLQRLSLIDEYYANGIGGYVINAPSLKYLNIDGLKGFQFCLIENAPELLEAEISDVYDITNENILESLTSAKRLYLSLSPSAIMPPTGKIFYQLLSLELCTTGKESWNLLSLMLNCSPKLQILKLLNLNSLYGDRNSPIDCKWNQPKCVPKCLLFHLETFVWTRYDWQREDEKEVATYILKNGRQLKKATLSTDHIQPRDLKKLEKRREMLDELANVVRASSSCHLVLESDTYFYD